jgi:hypothetical protein
MSDNDKPDAKGSHSIKTPVMSWDPKIAEATSSKLADRLSIWLLVGNASGLLLCFNAALDHKVCDWPSFRWTAIEFGAGAAAVLLAHVLTAFSYSWRGGIESFRAANPSPAPAEAPALGFLVSIFSFVLNAAIVLVVFLFAVGFGTLIHAPLGFLLDPNAPQMLCPP